MIVIDSKSLDVLKLFRVYNNTTATVSVKSIEFARRGTTFLINGSDRVMRVYDIDDIMKAGSGCGQDNGHDQDEREIEVEALQRLQDNVNRTQWKKCVFSGKQGTLL